MIQILFFSILRRQTLNPAEYKLMHEGSLLFRLLSWTCLSWLTFSCSLPCSSPSSLLLLSRSCWSDDCCTCEACRSEDSSASFSLTDRIKRSFSACRAVIEPLTFSEAWKRERKTGDEGSQKRQMAVSVLHKVHVEMCEEPQAFRGGAGEHSEWEMKTHLLSSRFLLFDRVHTHHLTVL